MQFPRRRAVLGQVEPFLGLSDVARDRDAPDHRALGVGDIGVAADHAHVVEQRRGRGHGPPGGQLAGPGAVGEQVPGRPAADQQPPGPVDRQAEGLGPPVRPGLLPWLQPGRVGPPAEDGAVVLAGDVERDAVGILGDALGKDRVSGHDVFGDHVGQNTGAHWRRAGSSAYADDMPDVMAQVELAVRGSDLDAGLRAAARLRRLAEQLEAEQVAAARRAGWSWQDIAARLGVTKQTVHRKYRRQEG
jgi:hypothetical protein